MKDDWSSVRHLTAVALIICALLVGYNVLIMPDYAPPVIVYAPVYEDQAASVPGGLSIRLNINDATEEDFQQVPGIGPVLAGRIVALRESRGSFESVSDLLDVSGIGEVTLERMRPYLYCDV